MDAEDRNDKRTRPQQQLYTPGSGPLHKSSPGVDNTMEHNRIESAGMLPPGPRGRGHRFRNRHLQNNFDNFPVEYGRGRPKQDDISVNDVCRRGRKPERPLYAVRPGYISDDSANVDNYSNRVDNSPRNANSTGKNGPRKDGIYSSNSSINFSNDETSYRNYRQVSEPRSTSPNSVKDGSSHYRNRDRDTRSMETSALKSASSSQGRKPPSGRRNSAGYSSDQGKRKYFDNIPPRFRHLYMNESGHHSLDSNINHDRDRRPPQVSGNPPLQGWSQTLPSRGRGRRKDSDYERENMLASYKHYYDTDGSKHSTPTGSRVNLYEPNDVQHNKQAYKDTSYTTVDVQDSRLNNVSKEQIRDTESQELTQDETPVENDTLTDLTNNFNNLGVLDWSEEVEKNLKYDNSNALSENINCGPNNPDVKKLESAEPKRSKRRRGGSRSKKSSAVVRSTSRGHTLERSAERPAAGARAEAEPGGAGGAGPRRERRDSHRSTRSSNLGSREDLDRWRSWRSYSREHTPERKIISQCNSRDPSGNRASSPRDLDGFRVPHALPNSGRSSRNQRRHSNTSNAWGGARVDSVDRGRTSPAPTAGDRHVGGAGAGSGGGGRAGGGGATEGSGGARGGGEGGRTEGGGRRKKRSGRDRRKDRNRTPLRNKSPVHMPASTSTNWRNEIIESKINCTKERSQEVSKKQDTRQAPEKPAAKEGSSSRGAHPGLLLLPQPAPSHICQENSVVSSQAQTKTLFDPSNPSKPIVVQTSPSARDDVRIDSHMSWAAMSAPAASASAEPRAACYAEGGERAARNRTVLRDVESADTSLREYCASGASAVLAHWQQISETRRFLQNALQKLLISDLKFCSTENVEHHFWKILYYNFIEVLRKHLTQDGAEKEQVVTTINGLIDEGTKYFENLVELMEKAYKFRVEDYINGHHRTPPKGLGFVGLGLHSVQKIYLFLGDLARYKEQVNNSTNYGKSKFWYTKAQQINPKNGRPYNQLAMLAIYSRRKFDAVYYYMRSLMSSNPFHSARESLISLFDENRKKYESAERKRRAAREAAAEAAAADAGAGGRAAGRGLRREVWVRAGGGRTTTLRPDLTRHDEELASMTCVELNKNFITSYLHVHGKLITKIGMESLHESASLMLRQFRALLRQQPLPITANRLLQLAALNMFAIETCAATNREDGTDGGGGGGGGSGGASAWAESALGVALLMFGSLVERCCALLAERDTSNTQAHADAMLMLPAIKVCCDWMLCHSILWNPPPSLECFKLGADADPWEWLARLMNLLEEQDDKALVFESEHREGLEAVRLSEDAAMAGFTPLMYVEVEPAYVAAERLAAERSAEHALRARRLLFFGTEYLVGVEPPVLRLHCPGGQPARYVSAVRPPAPPDDDEPLQDVSEDSSAEESSAPPPAPAAASDEDTRRLLRRRRLLEARRADMEQRRNKMQEILRCGWVSVELEVRPRWLVPDTNCFIDHLPLLERAARHPYVLAVPLVVVTELEGLSRCARVGGAARAALRWLGAGGAGEGAPPPPPGVRFATTRGSLLASAAFTAEQAARHASNDDRVLATALSLADNGEAKQSEASAGGGAGGAGGADGADGGGGVRLVREVVLLTDDRNLRVKALAAHMPARALPAFVSWAALEPAAAAAPAVTSDK